MAVVFLADDLKLGRKVAVKVMRPELALGLGTQRFLREIALEAALNHPHILALHDSGEADGLLYYVTPFVEGESVRQRLDREGPLSLEEAQRIAGQVASALAYAHGLGVVHRDIKPENILLSAGEAVVADFGIARAVTAAAGTRVTDTGLAVGTPAYMSPEQAEGSHDLDGRADLYSLGCVLYEMLSGEAPYTGPSAQAILAKKLSGPLPRISVVRETVPLAVEAVLARALARTPADRYPSAERFAEALAAAAAGTVRPSAPPAPWRTRPRTHAAVVVAAALAALALVAWLARTLGGRGRGAPDPALVAVVPFEVAGRVDTSLVTPDGIVELLYTRLSGEGGLRAVYPGSVTQAWRAAGGSGGAISQQGARAVAARAGAGRLLRGRVVGAAGRLAFSASLFDVTSGAPVAQVAEVTGPADSILPLLDRLGAELLVRTMGGPQPNLADLTSANLSALRRYLAGMEMLRRGHYREASRELSGALERDSTFALAALSLALAANLNYSEDDRDAALAHAWANRRHLSARDTLFLRAWVGSNYPAGTSRREELRLWESMTETYPDRWDAWFKLGAQLIMWGPSIGVEDAHQRAKVAFEHALEYDSTFAPALEYLVSLAAAAGDTAEVRRYARLYLSVDSLGDHAEYVRWRSAVALGDSALQARARSRFHDLGPGLLEDIVATAQLDGVALDDAVKAASEARDRASVGVDLFIVDWYARELELNRGHPAAALMTTTEVSMPVEVITPLFRVVEALYWDGDSATAAAAVRKRMPFADGRLTGATAQLYDVCTVALWRSAQGRHQGVDEAIRRLRAARAPVQEQVNPVVVPVCAAILEAQRAALLRRADAKASLERLDSLMREGPVTNPYIMLAANMTVMRLEEARGDLAAALAASRRHGYSLSPFGTAGLSTYLREEGRLAALTGDRAKAISAYRHYLALRPHPEARLATQVAQVRAALAALETP